MQQETGAGPLTAQKDRNGIVIRWAAHDDNGDDLIFSVWYRGVGEDRMETVDGQDLRPVLQLRRIPAA